MHRTTALKIHFLIILFGLIIALAAAVCLHLLKNLSFITSAIIFGFINIPFLVIAAIYLIRFRENLVVPKYPRDKRLNKAIKNLPYLDFGLSVLAVLFFIHNALVKHTI